MKVETDIIASVTTSPIGWAIIMYVETFKIDVIDMKRIMWHWPIFTNIKVSLLITDNTTHWDQRENVQFTDNFLYEWKLNDSSKVFSDDCWWNWIFFLREVCQDVMWCCFGDLHVKLSLTYIFMWQIKRDSVHFIYM